MIYGYARVSTDAQDLTNQLVALRRLSLCSELGSGAFLVTQATTP
jgi:DNA invertase Pin-like site-specific DNA recombinase